MAKDRSKKPANELKWRVFGSIAAPLLTTIVAAIVINQVLTEQSKSPFITFMTEKRFSFVAVILLASVFGLIITGADTLYKYLKVSKTLGANVETDGSKGSEIVVPKRGTTSLKKLLVELGTERRPRGTQSEELIDGLRDEVESTQHNAAVNLIIGIITAAVGIVVLIVAIFTNYPKIPANSPEVSTYTSLASKISLSLLVEFFSFFFLRLYKKNLDDIKYLTNEITNVWMKMIALETCLKDGVDIGTEFVVKEFAQTERNFILKKGESTVEIQRLKLEEGAQTKMLSSIMEVFKKK